jgi:4,5-DOPA dioxygenase extradiol
MHTKEFSMNRMPTLFVSHGSPTFAIDPGRAGPLLTQLGRDLPRPEAVLVLSPHWITRGLRVATTETPETIHDFGGFPEELYRIQYTAPGSTDVAMRALELLNADGWQPQPDNERGLDHGAWVPVRHLYPDADVPVFQVSMPHTLDGAGAVKLGRALAPLADEGVLIIGSGSITHNLYEVRWDAREGDGDTYATEFVSWARNAVKTHDENALANYLTSAPHARRAHPTPDHYLPLPFAFGASDRAAPVSVVDGGMTFGVLAMDAYVFGETAKVPA